MSRWLLVGRAMFLTACQLPPKDPFAAAERALRRHDLLEALESSDAVPVRHQRYPDARAAAGDIEQRMRRCHELILEALMMRAEWRDAEALKALHRAADHWPGQPSIQLWIAATEKRLRLFCERTDGAVAAVEATPSTPLVEIAKDLERGEVVTVDPALAEGRQDEPGASEHPVEVSSGSPLPMVPMGRTPEVARVATERKAGAAQKAAVPDVRQQQSSASRGLEPAGPQQQEPLTGAMPVVEPQVAARVPEVAAPVSRPNPEVASGSPSEAEKEEEQEKQAAPSGGSARPARVPLALDPVALGLIAVEGRLARRELAGAVRDLMELARRFPKDARVNFRLSRLLHQRALMHYGSGAIATAISDWQRVLVIDPSNQKARRMLERALAESQPDTRKQ